jgi:hypothetical protein
MDVEEYEEAVLQGARALLANPCLKVIEIESVTPGINEMMLSNQFERAYYDPFNRRLEREPVASAKASNFLFIRDRPAVETRLATAKKICIFNHKI